MSDVPEDRTVRRLAAVAFTDVVGYSARMQADEAGTLTLVRSDFEQMRQSCTAHGGQVLKSTGDGLLICFDSVIDAVGCVLEIQAAFAGRGAGALQHRIGLHLGDVYHQGGDVAGDGVNLAARLQGAAKPGTVCVSDAVFASVTGKVAMESASLGPLILKNIAQPFTAHLIAPVGTKLVVARTAPGGSGRRRLALAAAALLLAAAAGTTWQFREPLSRALADASAGGGFSRNPELKRAHALVQAPEPIAEDLALADDLVKPLLAARPNDPEVVTVAAEVAEAFLDQGFDIGQPRKAQAQHLTERAVQLAPDNPDALAALASNLLLTNTQLGRAETLARQAVARRPDDARLHRTLYVILAHRKSPETDSFADRMAADFAVDPQILYEIALHHLAAGDLATAEAWLDRSLALAPLAKAIVWKAKFLLEVHGDKDGVKDWLGRVPERQRAGGRVVYAFVRHALVSGETGTVRHLLDSIADPWLADGTYIFPKAMLVADLARIDRRDDFARLQYEAALKEVRAVQAADPADARPSRAELWVQIGLGNRAEAEKALRLNLQMRPTPYRWRLGLNWWQSPPRAGLILGDRAEALSLLREACAEPSGCGLLRTLFQVDPAMAKFRDDPEIVAIFAAASPAPTSH